MVTLPWRTQNLRALETETVIHHLGMVLSGFVILYIWSGSVGFFRSIVSVFWRRGASENLARMT